MITWNITEDNKSSLLLQTAYSIKMGYTKYSIKKHYSNLLSTSQSVTDSKICITMTCMLLTLFNLYITSFQSDKFVKYYDSIIMIKPAYYCPHLPMITSIQVWTISSWLIDYQIWQYDLMTFQCCKTITDRSYSELYIIMQIYLIINRFKKRKLSQWESK